MISQQRAYVQQLKLTSGVPVTPAATTAVEARVGELLVGAGSSANEFKALLEGEHDRLKAELRDHESRLDGARAARLEPHPRAARGAWAGRGGAACGEWERFSL